jgi:general secretion pathway protein D
MNNFTLWIALVVVTTGCAQMRPPSPPPGEGHLQPGAAVAAPEIPEIVRQTPFLPPPQPSPEGELYTVVVNDVPVRELLFALARDAELNVDLNSGVTGSVTLNAIDQTLPQILERIGRQVDLRYQIDGDTIFISPDTPYFRMYEISYVNLSRDVETEVNVATRVGRRRGRRGWRRR